MRSVESLIFHLVHNFHDEFFQDTILLFEPSQASVVETNLKLCFYYFVFISSCEFLQCVAVLMHQFIIINLFLGEEKLSYGYGGTGKASTDCKFTDYGIPFSTGDVVTSYVVSTCDSCLMSRLVIVY